MSSCARKRARILPLALGAAGLGLAQMAAADVDFGQPGSAVDLVIGYQPYYTESWSGVVNNGKQFWKKYLPEGSTAKFEIGLQGSVIVNAMTGEKQHIGYMGDMPA
ncbi:MAG: nitrate ABC transporter substrate-binding protein, partial [Gammaproteobacteria bacterium]